jgi:hypothetical protein
LSGKEIKDFKIGVAAKVKNVWIYNKKILQ